MRNEIGISRELNTQVELYKLNKRGQVQQYVVRTYNYSHGAFLETVYGIVGGAIQTDLTPVYPKNIGRANELTPILQAESEARSKVAKLKDKGYVLITLNQFGMGHEGLINYLESKMEFF